MSAGARVRARMRASFSRHPLAWGIGLVVLVALASSVTGLGNGFAYDDIPIILQNPMVGSLHAPWDYLTDSYWGPQRGNSLYRPLTIAVFSLEWAIGDGSPFPFHLANVLLYAGTAVVVLLLFRTLLPAWAALVGALVWAAHPVHVEAVANVVGQSEMLAGLPMLLAVTLYLRERRTGAFRPRILAMVLACYALALASKEHGLVLPVLLAAAELLHRSGGDARGDGEPRVAHRGGVPWSVWRATVLLTVAYLIMRSAVLGGLAGDTPHAAIESLSGGERAWVMLAILPEFARLLWWPARLYADYSPQAIPLATTPQLAHLPGIALLLLYGALVAWSARRDRVALFALLWLPITLFLVSNLLLPTGVMLAERTLFLPSVAIAILVGIAAVRLAPLVARHAQVGVQRLTLVALGAVLAAAIARSADRQLVWVDNPSLFSTTVVHAPNNYRAQHALGEIYGSAASWARAEEHLRIADSLFPGYDLIELSLARVLHFDDRCPNALAFYDRVLAKRPEAEVARIGRAACLLEMRQLSAARQEAVDGLARGFTPGPFGLILQQAESSLAAWDTVDARNRWHRAGKPVSKSSARLKVSVLLRGPPASSGGRRMPESPPEVP